jgi:hypothetical protein
MLRSCWMLAWLLVAIAGCSKDDPTAPVPLTTTVMGTVSDSAGTAVANAQVSLTRQSVNGIGQTTFGTTTSAGIFVFSNVASGNYTLWAKSANGTRVAGTTTPVPRPNTWIALTLVRPCAARGTVNGPDLSDVVVSAEGSFAIPDSTGAYLIGGIPPGAWTITVSRPLARTSRDTVITFAAAGDTVDVPPIAAP